MTRHREISIIVHHLTASGVIDERQESLARQAVYEGLKQIREERMAERSKDGSSNVQADIHT